MITRTIKNGLIAIMTLAALGGMAASVIIGDDADRARSIEAEIARLRAENRELMAQNEALSIKINAIHTDPRIVEQIAREELGMIRGDETLYLFDDHR